MFDIVGRMAVAAHQLVKPLVLAEDRLHPVLPCLRGIVPGEGLRRGSTVTVAGSTSLALALAAAPSAAGSWVGVVGLPDLGVVAARELGVSLERLALVSRPGDQWATVVAALVDALDVVLANVPRSVRLADARRLTARARERGSVLIPLVGNGRSWPETSDVRLEVEGREHEGLGSGDGHLVRTVLHVVVSGRGAAARQRRGRVHLEPAR